MVIELPEKVKYVIDTLMDAGYEAYAVGGCIRDSILGRKPEDCYIKRGFGETSYSGWGKSRRPCSRGCPSHDAGGTVGGTAWIFH